MKPSRRRFLQLGIGWSVAGLAPRRLSCAQGFTVGVGHGTDAYLAAQRAVVASGEWTALGVAGKTVVIKPNLVAPLPSNSGVTTDPEVVRALVDMALADGAQQVSIVETGQQGPHFSGCGYDFFASYDPRVALVDLHALPVTLAPVSGGLAYPAVYTPTLLLQSDVVFISVAKLKTHVEAMVSLSTKNLFGIPAVDQYISSPPVGRFAMHDRGLSQAIVDVNRLRPVHFAVIDGIWGMEGNGPFLGNPVEMNTVLAGRNAVAVDRVALTAMGIPQTAVQHLAIASRLNLGPADVSQVSVVGDPLDTRPFDIPTTPPVLGYPRVSPPIFSPGSGATTSVLVWYSEQCYRLLEVVRLYDDRPQVDPIRRLMDYAVRAAGYEQATWDGRANDGSLVPAGRYAVHVRAYSLRAQVPHSDAVGWAYVI